MEHQQLEPSEDSSKVRAETERLGAGPLRLAGGAGVSFAGKLTGKVGHVLVQVIFARLLGVDDFGRFALGITLVRMLGTIAPLGLVRAVVVLGSKYWRVDERRFKGVVYSAMGFTLLGGAFVSILLVVLAEHASQTFGQSMLSTMHMRMFALLVAPFALMRLTVEISRISHRMQFAVMAEDIAQPLVALLVVVMLLPVGVGLAGATMATAASLVLSCGLAIWFCARLFPSITDRDVEPIWETRELTTFAASISLSLICGVCCSMVDRLIVGTYRAPDEMAFYQAASQVAVAFTIILGSFANIFGPMAALHHARGEKEELGKLMRTSTNWGLYLAVPLFAFFFVVPGLVLRVTFGDPYEAASVVLVILAVGQLVNVGTGNVGVLLVTSGNQGAWVWLSFGALVTNGVIGMALTPAYGILGASIGNLLANLVLFGGGTLVARARLEVWPYERRTLKIAIAGVVAGIAGVIVERFTDSSHSLVLLASVAATVLVVFYGTVLLLGIEAEDRSLARLLLRQVRRKSVY